MKKALILFFVASVCFSCKKDEVNTGRPILSFQIVLNNDTSTLISSNDTFYLDLDTVKNNKTFNLILTNIGDVPIYEMTLFSQDNFFFPDPYIFSLLPTQKNFERSKSLKLLVQHNTPYDVSQAYGSKTLEMGDNLSVITMEVRSKAGSEITKITNYLKIRVYAELMSVSFWYKGIKYDRYTSSSTIHPDINIFGNQQVGVHYYEALTPVIMENTGNVPFDFSLFKIVTNPEVLVNSTLYPNNTITLSLPSVDHSSPNYFPTLLKINPAGTTFNSSQITPKLDSCGYILFNETSYEGYSF